MKVTALSALADGVYVTREGKPGIDLVSARERPDCLSSCRYWLVVAESARMDKTLTVALRPFTIIIRLHGGYV